MGIKIDYIQEKTPLGTAGCLGLLHYKDTKKDIIIHNGDIISDLNISNLLKFHKDSGPILLFVLKKKINSSPFGQILFKGQKVKKILEKPKNKNFINAGIYVFKKEVIKNILPKKLILLHLLSPKF